MSSVSEKHNHLFRAISLKSKTFRAERESVRSVKENMSVLYIIHFWMVPLFWELFLVMCEIVWYRGVVCPYRSTSHNASVRRLNSWSRVCGETLMLCVPVWGSALCVRVVCVCVCVLLLFSPLFFFLSEVWKVCHAEIHVWFLTEHLPLKPPDRLSLCFTRSDVRIMHNRHVEKGRSF